MLLSSQEAALFFRLQRSLLFFVNQHARAARGDLIWPDGNVFPPMAELAKVRDAFLERTDLLGQFLQQNPAGLSGEELAIVASWRYRVSGKFFVLRELKKYTVFLSSDEPGVAYGVTALTNPLHEVVGPVLPVMVEAVLLPFGDKVIYDGLLKFYNISFGAGIRRSLNESYQQAKDRMGIVTSLPAGGWLAPKAASGELAMKKAQ